VASEFSQPASANQRHVRQIGGMRADEVPLPDGIWGERPTGCGGLLFCERGVSIMGIGFPGDSRDARQALNEACRDGMLWPFLDRRAWGTSGKGCAARPPFGRSASGGSVQEHSLAAVSRGGFRRDGRRPESARIGSARRTSPGLSMWCAVCVSWPRGELRAGSAGARTAVCRGVAGRETQDDSREANPEKQIQRSKFPQREFQR
jgi:hypothetical protein